MAVNQTATRDACELARASEALRAPALGAVFPALGAVFPALGAVFPALEAVFPTRRAVSPALRAKSLETLAPCRTLLQRAGRIRPRRRVAAPPGALALAVLALGCAGFDEREPDVGAGDLVDPQQSVPSVRPIPAAGGSTGAPGEAGNPALGAPPSSAAPPGSAEPSSPTSGAPDEPTEGTVPVAECSAADHAPCLTFDSRPGACTQPGQCIEYCTVGVSLAGACLVQPG